MNLPVRFLHVACSLALAGSLSSVASAQATTAKRKLQLSGFALADGTFTGLDAGQTTSFRGGRNVALTVGGDLGFYSPGRYSLAAEVRGSYPVAKGDVVSQKSILGGVRFSREPMGEGFAGIFRPYVNVLFGRGQMDYQNGGYITPGLLFYQSNSNILQGGGGIELDVLRQFSLKIDVQAQHWKTPVLYPSSETLWSKQAGVGVTYRFGAGTGPRGRYR